MRSSVDCRCNTKFDSARGFVLTPAKAGRSQPLWERVELHADLVDSRLCHWRDSKQYDLDASASVDLDSGPGSDLDSPDLLHFSLQHRTAVVHSPIFSGTG
jgi:hypothetical protein